MKANARSWITRPILIFDQGDPNLAQRALEAPAGSTTSAHSSTNTHESGVDEPDLVKTDGRRIVTVHQGKLRVTDPAARRVTGELDLMPGADRTSLGEINLLLHGDRALVLIQPNAHVVHSSSYRVEPTLEPGRPLEDQRTPRLVLVDLSGAPKIVEHYRTNGRLLDARQVGNTARIVVRSTPRVDLSVNVRDNEAKRLAKIHKAIDSAPLTAWLPQYETISADGKIHTGQAGCDRLSRSPTYSGMSMITILSFDLGSGQLGDGDPVTVAADGDTVYSNGSHLYLAASQRWAMPARSARQPVEEKTQIYQFDISKPGRARYRTAASVPGWLINQYAMSEWNGHLRVATTIGTAQAVQPRSSGTTKDVRPTSSSTVYVLRANDGGLTETGRVTGLGLGEQIYGVRFVGGTGYVVTFRQVDPLYTVDLRDPASPKVTGELKITGYSAYLHPVGDGRLLGVGQEATSQGRRLGTHVSLFDVSDPARPNRLAQHHVRQSHSTTEYDAHAFLYWPAANLVVLPITTYGARTKAQPGAGALVLRATDGGFTEVGVIDHPSTSSAGSKAGIRRSLVAGGVLWTVSDAGLRANDLSTMAPLSWLPMT
ncbi:beta-propeller domain-containing protein [Micromonospora sp. NPDC003197]